MPSLTKHQSSKTTKLLFAGDSGSGKTGALASLAAAGYNLRILDFDNGLDVLKNMIQDPKSIYPEECLERIHYQTITDPMKNLNGRLVPKSATVWQRAIKALMEWKDEEVDFGPISSWTDQEILVLDSLSFLSNAAMDFVLSMNARLGQHPQLQDWGAGQKLVEDLIKMLYDDGVKCNVIITAHVKYIGEEGAAQKGYPNTLGKALPPILGRYFNTILKAESIGSGSATKRKIFTTTRGVMELKNTNPLKVAPEYPLETGLADYFKAVRG